MHHGCYAVECDSGILLRLSATEWSAPCLGLDNARPQQFAHPVLLKHVVLSLPSLTLARLDAWKWYETYGSRIRINVLPKRWTRSVSALHSSTEQFEHPCHRLEPSNQSSPHRLQSAVHPRGRIMLDRWSSLAAGVSLIARAAARMAAGRNW